MGSCKKRTDLEDRGFDFLFAVLIFNAFTLERIDRRRDYGEIRIIAIGKADDLILTVVYTERTYRTNGVIRRIISARRSSATERRGYETAAKIK